jgi:ArsR family transcriptional regulator
METNTAVGALSALAHETRLEIFRLLVRKGQQGLAAGDLSSQFAMPAATMSFHLKELSSAGLNCAKTRKSLNHIFCKLRSNAAADELHA